MCGGIGVGTGLSSVKGCISKDASFYRGILYTNGMKIHTLDNIPNKCLINQSSDVCIEGEKVLGWLYCDSEYFKGVTGSRVS